MLITEILSPWETVIKREMLFIESRESANDPAVDQSAQDGSPLHAFKAPYPDRIIYKCQAGIQSYLFTSTKASCFVQQHVNDVEDNPIIFS